MAIVGPDYGELGNAHYFVHRIDTSRSEILITIPGSRRETFGAYTSGRVTTCNRIADILATLNSFNPDLLVSNTVYNQRFHGLSAELLF